ncbi:MAG: hypothetical protein AB8B54_05290, partial [Sphingorhabdus sp.]
HALLSDFSEAEAITLPALPVSMENLVRSAARYGDSSNVGFQKNAEIQKIFASHPPLSTPRADSLGFFSDLTLDALVDNGFADA